MQPGTQRVECGVRAAGEYLDVTVIKIPGIAGNAEPLGFTARAVTKPDALNSARDPDSASPTLSTASAARYTSSSSVTGEASDAFRASSAFILACFASRLACEY